MASRRSYGSGSLTTRVDTTGREAWYGRWRINGRQVQRRIGVKRTPGERDGLTKKQAEQLLYDLIAATTDSADRVIVTVEALHNRYIADKGQRLKQTTTVADYNSIVRNHLEPYFGSRSIETLTKKDMRGFVDYLAGRGLKPKTIDNYFTYLAGLLNYAVIEQLIPASPARGVTLPEDADHVDELRFLEVFEVHDSSGTRQPVRTSTSTGRCTQPLRWQGCGRGSCWGCAGGRWISPRLASGLRRTWSVPADQRLSRGRRAASRCRRRSLPNSSPSAMSPRGTGRPTRCSRTR